MKIIRFNRPLISILVVLWGVSMYVVYDLTDSYVANVFDTAGQYDELAGEGGV
jgi:hypothetical protein